MIALEVIKAAFFLTIGALLGIVYTWKQISSGRRGIRLDDGSIHFVPKSKTDANLGFSVGIVPLKLLQRFRVHVDTTAGIGDTTDHNIMGPAVSKELPRYKCHKEVHALKIKAVVQSLSTVAMEGGSWDIVPEEDDYAPVVVSHAWYSKHSPQVGGYLVVYEDGYQSFSPAKAFEDGYTLLT